MLIMRLELLRFGHDLAGPFDARLALLVNTFQLAISDFYVPPFLSIYAALLSSSPHNPPLILNQICV